jgi:6-phosphogluconate dehydrogenase
MKKKRIEIIFHRCLSSLKDERVAASKVLKGPEGDHVNNNNTGNQVNKVNRTICYGPHYM